MVIHTTSLGFYIMANKLETLVTIKVTCLLIFFIHHLRLLRPTLHFGKRRGDRGTFQQGYVAAAYLISF